MENAASNVHAGVLFECLALPPHAPTAEDPHTPEHRATPPFAAVNHVESQEQALGSNPRLGRRAAVHYGLNRAEWKRCAALRM